jgi:hypothetical protein
MRIGAPEILWVLGLLCVLVMMVPTSFQHRGLLFLLLTGASVILGVALGIGEATRAFGWQNGSALSANSDWATDEKDHQQGRAPSPPGLGSSNGSLTIPLGRVGSFCIPAGLNRDREIERIVSKKLALFLL